MQRLTRTSIQTRLIAIVVLFVLGTGVLALVAAMQLQSRIMSERQAATRGVVQEALGVVTYYGQQEQSGAMTKDEAQKGALAVVSGLRYSGQEYFWVNDMHPTMLMHPFKPELDGT